MKVVDEENVGINVVFKAVLLRYLRGTLWFSTLCCLLLGQKSNLRLCPEPPFFYTHKRTDHL